MNVSTDAQPPPFTTFLATAALIATPTAWNVTMRMETSAPNATLRVSFLTLMAKFVSMNVRLASTKMTVQAGAKSVRLLAKAVGKDHWIATRVMSKVSNHSSKKGDVCLPVKMAGLFPTKISTLFA